MRRLACKGGCPLLVHSQPSVFAPIYVRPPVVIMAVQPTRTCRQACRLRCSSSPTASTSPDQLAATSSAPVAPTELQALINAIPFKKLAIWGTVAALAYQLHDFAGMVLGTFIVTFIGNSFVEGAHTAPLVQSLLPKPTVRRQVLVLLYFLMILGVFTLLGVLTIPDIAREGADFVNRLQSDNIWVILVEKMRHGVGDQVMNSLEKAVYLATSNDIAVAAVSEPQVWSAERSTQLGLAVSSMLKGYTNTAAKYTAVFLKSVAKFSLQALVSLILGFLFVWDMPTISRGISTLRHSRLAPVFNEVAPVLTVFGQLFGKALQVQAQIAVVNTALTAAGMWLLAIPGIGLLSLFVFLCSFIPIMGCIISTIPIGFVALTEYGFVKLAMVIIMVALVHFVEAYALNPAIYSAHLKLHPLMVLSVLLVAEHNLGVWGLLLAVPSTVFALDYLIRYPNQSIREVGERELSVIKKQAGLPPPVQPDGGNGASTGLAPVFQSR
ncbi:hypothetical protein Vretimale_17819 [Volvox reticuliferus]|uniref:AI-2E family transporter n=1 Tax=Volvox reticuliferus TaxID=1737510 RepID=A0A8J4GVY4_9CHLO|nr:hypothetical protein Vretifemale_19042 [Volvox reticuliferus]GIM14962.1 hypothetical protein Vretimale_17819 [Volvox reticuliferus]